MDGEPPMESETFTHYFTTLFEEHADQSWFPRVPRKPGRSLLFSSERQPFGWGIEIVEGLYHKLFAALMVFCTVIVAICVSVDIQYS